jgi:Family of unknown function (DUF5906)
MSKKPGFTIKQKMTTSAVVNGQEINLTDFRAYLPMHNYIFMPCREPWPAASIDAVFPPQVLTDAAGNPVTKGGKVQKLAASRWLDRNQPAHQMIWAPGMPVLIPDRLVVDGGWIERSGVICLNLYRAPRLVLGNAAEAKPWHDHVAKLFPVEAEAKHVVYWLAQRVQHPEIKINHALVLGGEEGIGKDTLLEPVKSAIAPWNFREVSPTQMMGRFNSFVKSTILRINEARDLGEVDRFKFYDHLKVYSAAPPDVLRVDEKHLREHYVSNCVGIIISTNYRTDGIYLSEQDRRHFVAWSELRKVDFGSDYFDRIWAWFDDGGAEHVAAYLSELDLSDFNPKRPPPKTEAWWTIVTANHAPEEAELADTIDKLGNPAALIIDDMVSKAPQLDWLYEPKSRRAIPHRMERCGYLRVNNPNSKEKGLWQLGDRRVIVYGRKDLSAAERLRAAWARIGTR